MVKRVFAYEIKDPEMEESSWFNWMSSKSSDKYPYESKEKRALRKKRRPCGHRGRDWNDAATSQECLELQKFKEAKK